MLQYNFQAQLLFNFFVEFVKTHGCVSCLCLHCVCVCVCVCVGQQCFCSGAPSSPCLNAFQPPARRLLNITVITNHCFILCVIPTVPVKSLETPSLRDTWIDGLMILFICNKLGNLTVLGPKCTDIVKV